MAGWAVTFAWRESFAPHSLLTKSGLNKLEPKKTQTTTMGSGNAQSASRPNTPYRGRRGWEERRRGRRRQSIRVLRLPIGGGLDVDVATHDDDCDLDVDYRRSFSTDGEGRGGGGFHRRAGEDFGGRGKRRRGGGVDRIDIALLFVLGL